MLVLIGLCIAVGLTVRRFDARVPIIVALLSLGLATLYLLVGGLM